MAHWAANLVFVRHGECDLAILNKVNLVCDIRRLSELSG
jgi:hypothetical protein